MRFCLAPTSSSPSKTKTGIGPLLTMVNSGTWPASDTSVTVTKPAASASSSVA
jgi:hypothetical protein